MFSKLSEMQELPYSGVERMGDEDWYIRLLVLTAGWGWRRYGKS